MPIRAPRCRGSAAMVSMVSDGRPEQQVVEHHRLVVQGDVGDFGGNAEDDVEIADRQ